MRKYMALILVLLMTICPAAQAETMEESAQEAYVFSFRGGVEWGMSAEHVKAAEAAEASGEEEYEAWQQLWYDGALVSNYTADRLCYLFREDRLLCAFYNMYDYSEEGMQRQYIIEALASKYGAGVTCEQERIVQLLKIVEDDEYDIGIDACWKLDDGTLIAVVGWTGGQYMIMYFDEAAMLTAGGVYNTAGL